MVPKPVKILSIKDGKWTFDAKRLGEILRGAGAGNRPLAIISITGPTRSGKSFLLNFLLRHLLAKQRGLEDTVGWETPDQPLTGFFWHRGGFGTEEKVTGGIWITDTPLTVSNSKGDLVAVFLMDTAAGSDDDDSEKLLLRLCLRVSTITIFNVVNELSEGSLAALAEAAIDSHSQPQPAGCQHVRVVVRDWAQPQLCSYSETGGCLYLTERLHACELSAKTLLAQIERVNCRLLPPPGQHAAEVDYNGSVFRLQPMFVNYLDELLHDIADGVNFDRTHWTPQRFVDTIEETIGRANVGSISINLNLTMTVDKNEVVAVPNDQPESLEGKQVGWMEDRLQTLCNDLVDAYTKQVEETLSSTRHGFLSPDELKALHAQLEAETLKRYANSEFEASFAQFFKHEKKMLAAIEACEQEMERNNTRKWKKFISAWEEALERCEKVFTEQMREILHRIHSQQYKEIHESIVNETRKCFRSMVDVKEAKLLEVYLKKLEERLAEISAREELKYEASIQKKVDQCIVDASTEYCSRLKAFLAENEPAWPDEEISGYHAKICQEIIENIDWPWPEKHSQAHAHAHGREELQEALNAKYVELKREHLITNVMELCGKYNVEVVARKLPIDGDLKEKVIARLFDSGVKHDDKDLLQAILPLYQQQKQKEIYVNPVTTPTPTTKPALSTCNDSESVTIGIDLGTSFSRAAIYRKGKVELIADQCDKTQIPSIVTMTPEGTAIMGEEAKKLGHEYPNDTIYDVKRLIGRDFRDKDIESDINLWPFNYVAKKVGRTNPVIVANGSSRHYEPEIISSKILTHLKIMAEKYLNVATVTRAVITVPVYFDTCQREAVKAAAGIAGLEVLQLVNETTAAAIAYFEQKRVNSQESNCPSNILIYDLGGGGFNASVLKVDEREIQVLAANGDPHLGGQDFDLALVRHCMKKFKESKGINLDEGLDSDDETIRWKTMRRLARLRNECEKAKKDLGVAERVTIMVDEIVPGHNCEVLVTRKKFEEMNMKLFKKTIEIVKRTLQAAKVGKDDIKDVVMVGGSSRIPQIQSMLSEFFDGRRVGLSINPDEAIVQGAAILAAKLNGSQEGNLQELLVYDPKPKPADTSNLVTVNGNRSGRPFRVGKACRSFSQPAFIDTYSKNKQ